MCGISGIIDLYGKRDVPRNVLGRMGQAMFHRGPDEGGFFQKPGLGFVSRRLSIVDLKDGQQPIHNEDGSVTVVYNGELFEHVEQRAKLKKLGHKFRTECDTEIIVHLYEEYGERMFEHMNGQFAFALYDHKKNVIILGRDRVGVAPLHWTCNDGQFYFASEIKSLIAAGIKPQPDVRGLDHVFTFFGVPARRTPFAGISAVLPGHYLKIDLNKATPAEVEDHC